MKAPTLKSLSLVAVLTLAHPNLAGVHFDPAFQANLPGTVHALIVLGDGKIVAGGDFQNALAKLKPDGSADASFINSGANSPVNALAVVDGGVLAGGRFSAIDNSSANNIARLFPSGVRDAAFAGGTSGAVDCLAVDAQGRALLGGSFSSAGGLASVYVARLLSTGEADPSFVCALRPSFAMEAGATALAVQADGKVVVGGNFETDRGFEYLVRLNEDGSLDESFEGDHGAILYVNALLPLANGQLLVAGQLHNGKGFIRRLNADRSVDPSFTAPEFDGAVHALIVGTDGKICAGGAFREPFRGLARMNTSGSADSSWNLELDGPVNAFAIDASGRLLVGGAFTGGLARIVDSKLNPHSTNANVFRAALKCQEGREYLIESSSDLVTWTEFGTGTANADGLEVVDPAPAATKRFFRARSVQ